jgi:uncharacterized Zn ribbon protein
MTVSNSDSDVSLLDLTDNSNDDKSEYALDKQSFFTAPVESNEVSKKEKIEKASLAEMLKSGLYAGLDNMSTVTMVNNQKIIEESSIKKGMSIKIDSLLGTSVSNETAKLLWGDGDRVSFSADAFATIFAETETLSKYPHELVTHTRNDNTPKLVGYNVEFKPGITIKFRRYGGCMIGNLTPLIEACSVVNMIANTKAKQKNQEDRSHRNARYG